MYVISRLEVYLHFSLTRAPDVGRAPKSVRKIWRREKALVHARIRNSDCEVCSLVAIPTELFRSLGSEVIWLYKHMSPCWQFVTVSFENSFHLILYEPRY